MSLKEYLLKIWEKVTGVSLLTGSSDQQHINWQERLNTPQAASRGYRRRTITSISSQARMSVNRRDTRDRRAVKKVHEQRTGSQATEIEQLQSKIAEHDQLLQEMTDRLSDFATIADIQHLRIQVIGLDQKIAEGNPGSPRSPRKSKDVGSLTGKVIELYQLLQEKVDMIGQLEATVTEQTRILEAKEAQLFNAEHGAYKQVVRKEEDIKRLEVEIAQSNRLLQEMTEEHSSLERNASDQKREIERLRAAVVRLNEPREPIAKTLSPEEHEQEEVRRSLSASDQKQLEDGKMETPSRYSTSTEGERTIRPLPPPPTTVGKVDTISVAEVADLVRIANSQIEQTSSLIMDSLSYRESPISSEELEDVLNDLNDYIGSWLRYDLRSKWNEFIMEPDPLITQLALQTGLVYACSHIINHGLPPTDGVTLSQKDGNVAGVGQVVDPWRALALTYSTTPQSESQKMNEKYLTGIALKLITAVGGSLETGLPPEYKEKLEEIVQKALELHRIISRDVVSMELLTYTVPYDTEFDPSRMEDTEGVGDETGLIKQDTVICTLEMGLQCRRKESGPREEWAVTMKAKVVLASTLEA